MPASPGDRRPRPERQCSQSRGPPPATRTAVFPIADVLAGLALTNRSIVLAIVAIRIFSMAVWIEARAGGLLCRTHQRSTYQERIVRDPAICAGQPTIRGTRVLVRVVLGYLAHGESVAKILAEFPSLSEEDIRAVIQFAAASAAEDLPAPSPIPPGVKVA